MKNLIYILLFLLICAPKIAAVSAYPKPIQITQPDGSSITIIQRGDEHFHWIESTDGHPLIKNTNGFLTYGTLNAKGDLIASDIIAQEISKRTAQTNKFLSSQSSELFFSQSQLETGQLKAKASAIQRSKTAVVPSGTKKILVILMSYKDLPFSKSSTEFNNQFNLPGYNANGNQSSIKEFFSANSYGQFIYDFDVMGPYTASQNMVYYGGNDASGNDMHPDSLIVEAIRSVHAANPSFNFSQYVAVNVIFAGYGEEANGSTAAIWSHQSDFTPPSYCSINHYLCTPELYGNAGGKTNTIGVTCHELTHIIGSPDYYDTNYDKAGDGQFEGTGYWDLMSSGNWNSIGSNLSGTCPANMTMYQKIRFGWVTPTVLDSTRTITDMPNAGQNAVAYTFNTPTRGEKYILENRQKTGYDAGIPGHGLLIYHIAKGADDLFYDLNISYPQKVYPVCASSAVAQPSSTAASYGNINSAGCPFPGSSSATSFTDAGTPSAKTWNGTAVNKPITSITENNTTKTISFKFMDGVVAAPAPLTLKGSEYNGNQYILSWQQPSLIPVLADTIIEKHWDNNTQKGGLYANQKTTWSYGQSYGADQLTQYVGKKWCGVKFYVTDATATGYAIELYKITAANSTAGNLTASLIKSQTITGVASDQWNEFSFTSPVSIEANTNYGIAIRYTSPSGYLPAMDKGPQLRSGSYNFGAFYGGASPFTLLTQSFDYNFSIRGLINVGSPVSYNVYRDNIKIANVAVLGDTIALSSGTYCVSLVNNGIESKKTCIDYIAPSVIGTYIFAKENMAYVCGTQANETIKIYNSAGQLYISKLSKGTTEAFYLPAGIWIIQTGSEKKKVIVN